MPDATTISTADPGTPSGGGHAGAPPPARRRRALLAYGAALAAVTASTLLRWPLQPLIGSSNSYTLFYPAIIVVSWFGGLGPGLAATLLSALAADVFFLGPGVGLAVPPRPVALNLLLFVIVGAALARVTAGWRRAEALGHAAAEARLRQERVLRQTEMGRLEGEQELRRLLGEQRRDREEMQTMARIGRILAGELELERLAQALTDEATAILGAEFGAFYTLPAERPPAPAGAGSTDDGYCLLSASGIAGDRLAEPPLRGLLLQGPRLTTEAVTRSQDTRSDPRFAAVAARMGLDPALLGVCSYLAAPVGSHAGRPLGCLVFGHAQPARFAEREERILGGLATQAEVALRNAYLYREARQARTSAEVASRSKDEFLATVSHELRTPLNAMMGWAQLLQMSRGDEQRTATGLETILRNAKLQAQLIDDLLDLSRIVSGKMRLDVRTLDLTRVIDGAVEAARPAAEAKGIRLVQLLDPWAGPVAGDPDRLQQVVWNLLSNAVKFTPKNGRVEVRLERVNSHLEITVADDGIGISAELLPFVFERFWQSSGATTRAHGGLGLGLAIVRHLVELHGGTVAVKSPGEGQGTTFLVRLPQSIAHLPDDRVHPRAKDGSAEAEPTDLRGVRVLVVDDEADSRETLRHILEHCHAEVLTVGSTAEAMAELSRFLPSVLLSDIGMPGEDGYGLIARVRALPPDQGGQIPAAALTAFARAEDRRRVLLAGFDMHVSKPVEIHELCAVVANLARRGPGRPV